jgi:TfoX/Sxy family transcriptional regulator of competence genes
MTPDEIVAFLRCELPRAGTIRETKMFGGTGFMLNGNMIAGTFRQGLLVRVGKDRQAEALAQPGSQHMEMRGRLMEGYVHVEASRLTEDGIRDLLKLALPFVSAMPAKPTGTKTARTKEKRK